MFDIQATLSIILFLTTIYSTNAIQQINFNIPEEQPVGTIVGNLLSKMSGAYSAFSFAVIPNKGDRNSGASFFDIDTRGNIKIKKRIDRDKLDRCQNLYDCYLTFQVFGFTQDKSAAELDTTIDVRIRIGDLNDNSPTWSRSFLETRINEDFPVGKTFTVEPAIDNDYGLNGTISYRLTDNTNTFTVVPSKFYGQEFAKTEQLSIMVNKPLDREMIEKYNLTLIASDAGAVSRSTSINLFVHIEDLNDHPPKFNQTSYRVSIPETTPLRQTIIAFFASDPDKGINGEVEYIFAIGTSMDVRRYFRLDSRTGVLSLGQTLDYDIDETREFDFVVVAQDRSMNPLSASAQVFISVTDVNDCYPLLSVYQLRKPMGMAETTKLEVLENSDPLSVLGLASVVDCDSGSAGEADCDIQGKANDLFKLQHLPDKVSGRQKTYSILNRERFDRETHEMYLVSIICRDHGSPILEKTFNLYVHILDVNDEKPTFTKPSYVFSVKENLSPPARVGTVRATDRDAGENARISYSIKQDSEHGRYFQITPRGDIMTTTRLDRESKAELNLVVIANDHGNPSLNASVSVIIRVDDDNDCSPHFEHPAYTFEVQEGEPPDTLVGNLTAYDEDIGNNAFLDFSIELISDGSPVPFQVVSGEKGLAQIRTTGIIDRENPGFRRTTDNAYTFNVRAIDKGVRALTGTTLVTVHIKDKNDNTPVWIYPSAHHNEVNVSTHEDVGTTFATLRATDNDEGDNGKIEYFIKSGDTDHLFALDPHTGDLQIRQALKSPKSYTLRVIAKDRPGHVNGSRSKDGIMKINVVNQPKERGGHRGDFTMKTEDINEKIIIALISCTAAIALILVCVIVAARCVLMRSTRSATKRGEKQREEALGNHREGLLFVPTQHGHFDATLRRPEITAGTLLASNDSGKGGSIDGLCDPTFSKKTANTYQISTLTNLEKIWPPTQHYTSLSTGMHHRIPEYYDVVREESGSNGVDEDSRRDGLTYANTGQPEEHNLIDRTRSQDTLPTSAKKKRYHPVQASSFV